MVCLQIKLIGILSSFEGGEKREREVFNGLTTIGAKRDRVLTSINSKHLD